MAILRIERGADALADRSGAEIELGPAELGIGRGVGNELHFRNPWLSRVHARIFRRAGRHCLEDLSSRNGTYLNGEKLSSRAALTDGDSIVLGDIEMRYLDVVRSSFTVAESRSPLTGDSTVIMTTEQLTFEGYLEPAADTDRLSDASLLPALNAAAAALISHYPLAELVELILKLVLEAVDAERGALLLRSRVGDRSLKVKAVAGFSTEEEVHVSATIIDEVLVGGKAILTLDAQTDERFDAAVSIQLEGIRSLICVPLWNNREVIGLVYLDHRISGRPFSSRDLKLVGLIANMAAIKIENGYLLEEHLEMRRMEEQLAVGAKIQQALLPSAVPELAGYEICGSTRPCFEVGGDYYDFILKSDGKMAVIIADVAGKGVGAALLMASLQASLRALIHTAPEPAVLVSQLNRVLLDIVPANRFTTLFYAELDADNHVLEYVSGGHNPGLLVSDDGDCRELMPSGPLVGLFSKVVYTSRRVSLPAGSTLLLYTDGVTELMTAAGEEFGTERLLEVLRQGSTEPVTELVEAINERMTAFSGTGGFDDDSTLVVVRRTA